MYVVCVNFEIKPDAIETFMPLMMQQAKNSLDNETGCKQFDVCVSEQANNQIFLYEIYVLYCCCSVCAESNNCWIFLAFFCFV